jgi:hypothetical protein
MKTIVGLYEEPDNATKALQQLERAGFAESSVRTLGSVNAIWQHLGCTPGRMMAKDFSIGAAFGIAGYSLFGVLVAVGEVTLGFESTISIGALFVFMLLGVFVGGMLGVFFGMGDVEEETGLYVAGIRRGGVLVVVRTADEHAQRALNVLDQSDAQGVKICWRTSDHPQEHHPSLSKDHLTARVRWVARALGLALIGIVLLFFIGEGVLGGDMPNLLTMSLSEDFMLLALLMTLLGIVVAWHWEGIGGLLIVGSVLLFESINALALGHWRVGVLDPFFLLVGLLFLWIWWHTVGAELDHPTTGLT